MLLLDLFCGAGGSAAGYWRAGFNIIGIDAQPQPRYPYQFVKGNALAFLENPKIDLTSITLIHASPPCQRYSAVTPNPLNHHDLVAKTRDLLEQTNLPYVIENVPGAPLIPSKTVRLCGTAFGLAGPITALNKDPYAPSNERWKRDWEIQRHRLFESNIPLEGTKCYHSLHAVPIVGNGSTAHTRNTLGYDPTIDDKREAMECEWMTRDELAEAIPPAYTEYIGNQIIQYLTEQATQETKELSYVTA